MGKYRPPGLQITVNGVNLLRSRVQVESTSSRTNVEMTNFSPRSGPLTRRGRSEGRLRSWVNFQQGV